MSQSATRPVKAVGGTSSYTVTAAIDRWKVQANSPSPRQDTCFDIGGPSISETSDYAIVLTPNLLLTQQLLHKFTPDRQQVSAVVIISFARFYYWYCSPDWCHPRFLGPFTRNEYIQKGKLWNTYCYHSSSLCQQTHTVAAVATSCSFVGR